MTPGRQLLTDLRRVGRLERRTNEGRWRPRLLARLYLSNRAWLYPLDRYLLALFLSDLKIEGPLSRVNPSRLVAQLQDKHRFHAEARARGLSLPMARLLGRVVEGRLIDGDASALPPRFFAKPVTSRGGHGARIASGLGNVPPGIDYLLEELIEPHAYAQAIFPGAINTIRVMTGRIPSTGELVRLGAVHRFGTPASAPVDNFKAGGLAARIDLATGGFPKHAARPRAGNARPLPTIPPRGRRLPASRCRCGARRPTPAFRPWAVSPSLPMWAGIWR